MGAALRPAPHTVRNRPEREAPERESFRQRAETSLPHATSHLRFAGNPAKGDNLMTLLHPYGVKEVVRTGTIAIEKGSAVTRRKEN